MGIRSERRFLGRKGIGDQAGEQIAQEVDRASVPGVFNLAQVLELVDDRLNDRAFLKQQTIRDRHQLVGHALFKPGDQLQSALEEHLEERAGDIPAVAEEFAQDVLGELLHQRQLPVVDVAGRAHDGHQIAPVVDDQVQLKAVEPAHRRFAALGDAPERLVAVDASVVADLQRCGIDKGNAVGRPEPAPAQEHQQRGHCPTHELDEAAVADQPRELGTQMLTDVLEVIILEGPVSRDMKVHHECHHLAQTEAGRFDPLGGAVRQQASPPEARKGFTKIVDGTEYVQ